MMRVDVERSVEIIAEVDAAATAEAWNMWFGREQSRGPWRSAVAVSRSHAKL
jgi:hypothetical protein